MSTLPLLKCEYYGRCRCRNLPASSWRWATTSSKAWPGSRWADDIPSSFYIILNVHLCFRFAHSIASRSHMDWIAFSGKSAVGLVAPRTGGLGCRLQWRGIATTWDVLLPCLLLAKHLQMIWRQDWHDTHAQTCNILQRFLLLSCLGRTSLGSPGHSSWRYSCWWK